MGDLKQPLPAVVSWPGGPVILAKERHRKGGLDGVGMLEAPRPPATMPARVHTHRSSRDAQEVAVKPPPFSYAAPTTVAETVGLLSGQPHRRHQLPALHRGYQAKRILSAPHEAGRGR